MLVRFGLRPLLASAALLLVMLPARGRECMMPPPIFGDYRPVAYHPTYHNALQAYGQFVCLIVQPSRWRTLLYIEECGLRKIAVRLHLRPASNEKGEERQAQQETVSDTPQSLFKEVPRGSWIYPALHDLERAGLAQAASSCYFRSVQPQPFTRYGMAVAVQRAMAGLRLTYTDNTGTRWEAFACYPGVPRHALHALQALWRELRPELKAIGVAPEEQESFARNLDAYLNSSLARTP